MKKLNAVIIFLSTLLVLTLLSWCAADYLVGYALTPDTERCRNLDESRQYVFNKYEGLQSWYDSLTACGALRDTMICQHGYMLHAVYAAAPDANGTAIVVHGYTDNHIRILQIAAMYQRDLHYNIVVPDLRYHGLSEGEAIRMGWLDRFDVLRWADVSYDLFGYNSTVLHGISMGGATVLMAAGEKLPPYIHAVIDDCGYTSVWDQYKKELGERFHLPSFPVLDVASELCMIRYGWDFHQASAIDQVRRSSVPIFFIHGDKDDYVPTEMVHRLYDAKGWGIKELWIVPGAAHAASYKTHPEEYTRRVKEFLDRFPLSIDEEKAKNFGFSLDEYRFYIKEKMKMFILPL